MKNVTLAGASLAAMVAASTVQAQTNADEPIVVTATRIQQSIQDVPVSITAYTGEDLKDRGIGSIVDLARQTPGLSIGQSTGEGGIPLISIRGVSLQDYSDINESPSAVYINEFYKGALFGLDNQLFDMERVEVLRGPQGTLFGRNATGGVIQYVTVAPSEAFSGYGELGIGEYGLFRAEGAVGGRLAEGVQARVSYFHKESNGYNKNLFAGRPNGNGLNVEAVRAQLRFKPTTNFSADLFFQYSENNSNGNMFTHISVLVDPATGLAGNNPGGVDTTGYRDPTPGNPWDVNVDAETYLKTKQYTVIGRFDWNISDALTLTSITGYEASHKDMLVDSDASPNFVRESDFHPDAEEFSQELRLAGDMGDVRWVAGAYYFNYDVKGTQASNGVSFVSANYEPMDYSVSTKSYALFGNVTVDLSSTLSVDAGLRYTKDKKSLDLFIPFTFTYNPDGSFAGFGSFTFSEATVGDLSRIKDDNLSFTGRLNWKPNDDTLVYAGISRGYKGGTFNLGLFALPLVADYPVMEEQLTSYEMGLKLDLLPAVRLNASAFYYDYKDYQAFLYDSTISGSQIFNADAKVHGFEAELLTRPFDGFSLSASAAYLHGEVKDVEDKRGNIEDRRMALAPRWTLGALARYAFAAPWGGELALQGDVVYKSMQYFDVLNSPALRESGYAIANAQVSWSSADDHWRVAVRLDNVADKFYRNYVYDFSSFNYVQGMTGKPRWLGASVAYRW